MSNLKELAAKIENMLIGDQLEMVKQLLYAKEFEKASMFIRHLVEVNERLSGRPKNRVDPYERKQFYQWILSECRLRFPDVTEDKVKAAIMDCIKERQGDEAE
jgi:hypothetical protein